MCRRTTCKQCHQPTFAGCGAHVEQVLGDVAPEDRCQCATTGGGTAARSRRWPWSKDRQQA